MSSRSRRERSFSRSRSRSRSKHYVRMKHERTDSSKQSSNHYDKDSLNRRNSSSHDRSKSRSYSYSNSRSRSRSRSRGSNGNKKNYRENAELPSDHPLFSIVSKQRQNQKKSSKESSRSSRSSRSKSPQQHNNTNHGKFDYPKHHNKSSHNNYRQERWHDDDDDDDDDNKNNNNKNNNNYHHYRRRDNGYHQRRYNNDYRRRDRDRDRYNNNNNIHDDEDDDNFTAKTDVENLHSKFELNFHTGHKQQVLAKKKQEISPQITAAQAHEIHAVASIVQQQEEISEIVESQQRKLKQKTTIEKIKEKILMQKQQMMARKQNKENGVETTTTNDGLENDVNKNNIFMAASQLNAQTPNNKEVLPNITQMMMMNGNGNNNKINNNHPGELIDILQRQAIQNLATFVKQHGNALEQHVREKSKNDPKFSWLYDEKSNGYQYYQFLLKQQQQQQQDQEQPTTTTTAKKQRKRRRFTAHPTKDTESGGPEGERNRFSESGGGGDDEDTDNMHGVLASNGGNDQSLDRMNAYINKLENAAKEKRDSRFSRSNQMSIFNGGSSHHIGHYLPKDELNKFNKKAKGDENDRYHRNRHKLGHKNRGHALLKKMGWNEGQGLGKNKQGMRNPVSTMINKKENNSGIGGNDANGKKPWDPEAGDDQFQLYKKKMMLSYRYRPNPLGNPRKDYY